MVVFVDEEGLFPSREAFGMEEPAVDRPAVDPFAMIVNNADTAIILANITLRRMGVNELNENEQASIRSNFGDDVPLFGTPVTRDVVDESKQPKMTEERRRQIIDVLRENVAADKLSEIFLVLGFDFKIITGGIESRIAQGLEGLLQQQDWVGAVINEVAGSRVAVEKEAFVAAVNAKLGNARLFLNEDMQVREGVREHNKNVRMLVDPNELVAVSIYPRQLRKQPITRERHAQIEAAVKEVAGENEALVNSISMAFARKFEYTNEGQKPLTKHPFGASYRV